MAEVAKKEPSMEDILSSIRKIIAEESGQETPSPVEQAQMPVEPASAAPEPTVQEPVADMMEDIRPTIEADAVSLTTTAPEVEMPAPVVETVVAETAPQPSAFEIAPPATEDQMSVEAAVQADTMEQIEQPSLASIAASIQGTPAEQVQPKAMAFEPAAAPEMTADVVDVPAFEAEMAEDVLQSEEPVMSENPIHVEMAEAVHAPEAKLESNVVDVPSEEDMAREEEAFRGALMSPSADNAVTDAFDRLKRSAMDDIDAKTEAILRPMLREWLDEHLPSMVEKMVREEIERVARG